MTSVPFGNAKDHAVVLYDRPTQVCVVVANTMTHIQDAITVVNSINASLVWVIAPPEAKEYFNKLSQFPSLVLFEYAK